VSFAERDEWQAPARPARSWSVPPGPARSARPARSRPFLVRCLAAVARPGLRCRAFLSLACLPRVRRAVGLGSAVSVGWGGRVHSGPGTWGLGFVVRLRWVVVCIVEGASLAGRRHGYSLADKGNQSVMVADLMGRWSLEGKNDAESAGSRPRPGGRSLSGTPCGSTLATPPRSRDQTSRSTPGRTPSPRPAPAQAGV